MEKHKQWDKEGKKQVFNKRGFQPEVLQTYLTELTDGELNSLDGMQDWFSEYLDRFNSKIKSLEEELHAIKTSKKKARNSKTVKEKIASIEKKMDVLSQMQELVDQVNDHKEEFNTEKLESLQPDMEAFLDYELTEEERERLSLEFQCMLDEVEEDVKPNEESKQVKSEPTQLGK